MHAPQVHFCLVGQGQKNRISCLLLRVLAQLHSKADRIVSRTPGK